MSHIAYLARNKTVVLHVPSLNVVNAGSHAGNKITMQVILLASMNGISHSMSEIICDYFQIIYVQHIIILPTEASLFMESMKMESRFDNASILRNMQLEF